MAGMSVFAGRVRDSHGLSRGPSLFGRSALSLALRGFLARLLGRLATAADPQEFIPPTAADLGAFAYRVEMFGVMLLNTEPVGRRFARGGRGRLEHLRVAPAPLDPGENPKTTPHSDPGHRPQLQ